ncbi:MAG: cation transporter [Candidatus Lokiarchaeota archaeon]|nr:cation transporter [Candidatus Lokiarchaeota archaeon]
MSKSSFSEHLFQYRSVERKKLYISLIITTTVMVLEIIGGLITNSIALLSDAGHMFTHSFAIGISLLAINIARKPPCHHKTFGLYRAEVLAAFINGLFLIPIVGIMVYEAILRFLNPEEVFGFYMLLIALIGLLVNLTSIKILQGSHNNNLNVKSVFYHMIGDAASSIGIVIASIIILYTNFNILDPIVSIGISMVILYWAWSVLKESTRILLEMAPKGLNIDTINDDLKNNFKEIIEIYNMHLWTITPDMLMFSAYIKIDEEMNVNQDNLISEINTFLSKKYNIIESTIQVMPKNAIEACNI